METQKTSFDDVIRRIIREEFQVVLSSIKQIFNAPSVDYDEVIDLKKFCKYVGCSKSHAYKLTSKRALKFSRRNGKIWFKRSEVDEWLMSNPIIQKKGGSNEY